MNSEALLAAPFSLLSDLIRAHALERPSRRALVQADKALTYAELDSLVDRIASGIQRDGIAAGSAVAIVSGTGLEAVAAFFGALRAGCVPAPIAPSCTQQQIVQMIVDAGAPLAFVDPQTAALLAQNDFSTVRLDELDSWLPSQGHKPTPVTVGPDDPFNVIYSSGTTGTPKGIVQTHGMRWRQTQPYERFGLGNAVMMVSTPIYSHTTLVSLLPTLAFGATAVLLGKFDARLFVETAERERATHAMLVPIQYQRIMALPDFDRYDLTSFVLKTCTSAPFPPDLKRDVLRRWPGMLVEFYGMSEGGGTSVLYANQFPEKLHTVGQPLEDHDIRIIDSEGGELPRGQVGEVVGRSPTMMLGYHGRPDATSAAEWHDREGNRFIRHGDIGRFDEDGFLILLGRSKDMIISGGFNIYPADLEGILAQHPDVAECAVIGVASERWGETPFAYYVSRGEGVSPSEVLAWVNGRVGKTQRLSGAAPIAALPRNDLGKVAKVQLRELHARVAASTPEQAA
jgi:acyl-CoA synthetase (AMP-forming)/AMP-acid ligase II